MSKREEVQKEFEEKLRKAEIEDTIAAILPITAKQICVHSDHASVTYEPPNWPSKHTLAEAVAIYEKFKDHIVQSEHWRDGCLSCRPAEINDYAKLENTTMDGASHAEILLHTFGDKGEYQECELSFWCKISDHWIQVDVKIQVNWKWMPEVTRRYNKYGDCTTFNMTPRFIGEDQRINWGGTRPNYRISYFWADEPNFRSWLSTQLESKKDSK